MGWLCNNTTVGQLNLAVANPFPYYDNIIQEGAGSAIYMGYRPSDSTAFALSAWHFNAGNAAPITIQGLNYPLVSNQKIPNSDLRLLGYRRGDLQVPSLPSVPLATSIPTLGQAVVMIGNGLRRTENATTDANTSDASTFGAEMGYDWSATRLARWGFNNVDFLVGVPANGIVNTLNLGSYTTEAWSADFDEPGAGEWVTSNEGMGALNDSGGGAFAFAGGQWVLTGVTTGVDSVSSAETASLFTRGSNALYRGTFFTDVGTFDTDVTAVTGLLIPEPSSLGLAAMSGLLFLRRRRPARQS